MTFYEMTVTIAPDPKLKLPGIWLWLKGSNHKEYLFAAILGRPGTKPTLWPMLSARLIRDIVEAATSKASKTLYVASDRVLYMRFRDGINLCLAHGHIADKTVDIYGLPSCERYADEIREESHAQRGDEPN